MATNAVTAKPYDPVKALEGMFNGSVTRIAYALKDPANYGASTRTVLTEVAKRFHDALDDCEIQLLDAKWYLEHQLALNRLRREAKARELGTAAKRKHDEISDKVAAQDETPTKKAKVESEPQSVENTVAPEDAKVEEPLDLAVNTGDQAEKEMPKGSEEQPSQDDFSKPTPQATPAATNDDFNFESMFGDPVADTGDNEDLSFDMGMEDSFDVGQDPDSLGALIPGLEDYANQPMDSQISTAGGDALPAFSNDFGLPEIGGTNDFDDFLNDDRAAALDGEFDLNDPDLRNMDFDESLFG